ncbi:DUF4231 domain-containing protein [Actinomadura craniellae]|nr:DUF4231 domain-containing protein [Actinomadura craniellae]
MELARMSRSDLPRLYRVASDTSRSGQRATVALTALLLLAGLASAILALAGGRDGPSWHGAADLGAALLFALATLGGAWLGGGEAQRRWYDGRAAAESIKTMSWKYVMRAAPFEDDATADGLFLERMRAILASLQHLRLAHPPPDDPHFTISPAMHALRDAPLEVKRASYIRYRVQDQIDWYQGKARRVEQLARRWRVLTVTLGAAGFAGALLRATGKIDLDALGIAAACLASITAWTQLRQYWPLTAAYRLAVNELLVISTESEQVGDDPAQWAAFCERSETAVSREHTMWRARAR